MANWSRARVVLLVVSVGAVTVLAAGGLVLRAAGGEGSYRQVVTFSEVLSLVLENYVDEPDTSSLMAGSFEGLLAGLDANGAYLAPADVETWKREVPAGAVGPGLTGLKAGGMLQIVYVAPGSSADGANLRSGDQVRAIDDIPVRGESLAQIVKRLTGAPGSKVKVSVIRPREGFRREDVEMTRAARKDEPFTVQVQRNVAVLTPTDPGRVDAERVGEALRRAREEGADRLLLDVRAVASGDVRAMAGVAGLFTSGEVLRLKDKKGTVVETLEARGDGAAWAGPVAVLVGGATAGTGEAITEVLRSRRGAPVYGESTYGLGSEPRLFALPGGDGVLIPALQWEPVGGKVWERKGLEPDTVVRGEGRPDDVEADQLRRTVDLFSERQIPIPAERRAA